jgi:hypothetical protein
MANAELEKRLTVLQDIEAIQRLKAEYCDICDDAHNPDRMKFQLSLIKRGFCCDTCLFPSR